MLDDDEDSTPIDSSRLQKEEARRQTVDLAGIHQVVYNHNGVLMSQAIEEVDFGAGYFVRNYPKSRPRQGRRVTSSAKKRSERLREAQKATAGDCCICFGRTG